ncbi:hypothetical protein [Bdellovibrio sp. BCCA]|uniref:hypothetical protein n=1 Tax=Bdellovibrio sp. BCCA TaxID=3136281 RepID=UPI0030F1D7FB
MSRDEWTDEEFARFTKRMNLFKEDPKSLSTEVYEKCKALHEEIKKDSKEIQSLISKGIDLNTLKEENPIRAELSDWIAKTP